MGHMLNNTIQDLLVRRARMQGKNALWVPGTDHASIATEAKVVQKLRAKKASKKVILSRDEVFGACVGMDTINMAVSSLNNSKNSGASL
jgi:valyl-tRNA synthetase